jgi:hypothetical protein
MATSVKVPPMSTPIRQTMQPVLPFAEAIIVAIIVD